MTRTAFCRAAKLCGLLLLLPPSGVTTAEQEKETKPTGKELAVTYCQACHYFEGTDQAGSVAPPLVGMKARFPDQSRLRDLIYDPHVTKAHTMMPPFGRNGLLSEAQIEQIIQFLYTL